MQLNFVCQNCLKENKAGSVQCKHCSAPLGTLGALNSNCPHCGSQRVPFDRFCGYCGKPLEPLCPNCGNSISQDSRYCPKCSFFCGGGREGLK